MMKIELSPADRGPTAPAPLLISGVTNPRPVRRRDIAQWLRNALSGGPRLSVDVIAEAERVSISRSTIYRYLECVGVLTVGTGRRQPRLWILATQLPQLQQSSSRR